LHLGVSGVATKFALERIGYNLADFRIPDERGWVAKAETIDEEEGDSLQTALPLDNMLSSLLQTTELAQISTDPGRYICNFVYFHSLRWVKRQLASTGTKNEVRMK
jgi:pyroglutamyl-peptidase